MLLSSCPQQLFISKRKNKQKESFGKGKIVLSCERIQNFRFLFGNSDISKYICRKLKT